MKRKIVLGFLFLVITACFTGCEGLFGNCKICSLNTYENDNLILSQSEAEYCDAELISIQAIRPTTDGNTVTKWECN